MTKIERMTKETQIECELTINGNGEAYISTGVPFFDHMLEAFVKHSLVNLRLSCIGDIQVDYHHTVEDVGIVIGQALKQEIYPAVSIERFSSNVVLLDEVAIECVMDISNRAFLYYEIDCDGDINGFDTELVEEFFRALVTNSGLSVHLVMLRGKNKHHILEATFKAFAVTLRRALEKNTRINIPSTKGVI